MSKTELVPSGDLMRSLGVLEQRIQWVKCPLCDDEVTKLRPCTFWNGSEQKSHACIECTESVKGLTYLAALYPVVGVDVDRVLLPVYEKLGRYYVTERSYMARVAYRDWGFTVWPEATHLAVLGDRKTPDQKKTYDNTFQVWFALKKAFEEGPQEDTPARTKSGWKL